MGDVIYPGTLVEDDAGYRLVKCYMYKFVKNRIVRKPRYDRCSQGFTDKKYFWFNASRPLFGFYHKVENMVRFAWLLNGGFLEGKKQVFFMPQYIQGGREKKRKSIVYCCSGVEFVEYLRQITYGELQNITVFDSSLGWAIDIFEDLVFNNIDDKDVVVYFSSPKSPLRPESET